MAFFKSFTKIWYQYWFEDIVIFWLTPNEIDHYGIIMSILTEQISRFLFWDKFWTSFYIIITYIAHLYALEWSLLLQTTNVLLCTCCCWKKSIVIVLNKMFQDRPSFFLNYRFRKTTLECVSDEGWNTSENGRLSYPHTQHPYNMMTVFLPDDSYPFWCHNLKLNT